MNGIFTDKSVASAVFSAGAVNQKPTTTFTVQGKYYIVTVSAMKKPDMSKLAEKVELFDQMQSARNSETLAQSLINQLKAKSEIQVSPSVLAEG